MIKFKRMTFHNVVPANADLQDIARKSYYLTFGGQTLGFLKEDSLEIGLTGIFKTIGVDSIAAAIARADFVGWQPQIRVTLMSTTPEFVQGVLMTNAFGVRTGTSADGFGIGDPEINAESLAEELDIIPTSNAAGVKTNSFRFWKAYADTSQEIVWSGSKNNFQEASIVFNILPDLDEEKSFRYGIMGNILANDTVPLGVFITTNNRWVHSKAVGLKAITLEIDDQQQLDAVAVLGTASSTDTALVNNAGGTGTDDTVEYDNLSSSWLVADVVVKIGSELLYVKSVGASSFVATRGYGGTSISNHADNTSIAYVEDLRRVRITDMATWASSVTGDVTVGNDAAQPGTTSQKGRIAWVSAGTSNVTATFNTVASPNLVVTTN